MVAIAAAFVAGFAIGRGGRADRVDDTATATNPTTTVPATVTAAPTTSGTSTTASTGTPSTVSSITTVGALSPVTTATGPAPLLAVPAYFAPGPDWDRLLLASGNASSGARLDLAVINPSSGPGPAPSPEHARVAAAAKARGVTVFGYVATGYGARSTVISDIEAYRSFYGIGDIFLDETTTDCATLQAFYLPLIAAVRANGGAAIANPGKAPEQCWADAVDVVVTYEGTLGGYLVQQRPEWTAAYPPTKFWDIVYEASSETFTSLAPVAAARNVGRLYVTDDVLPNPYDRLPAWLSASLPAPVAVTPGATATTAN